MKRERLGEDMGWKTLYRSILCIALLVTSSPAIGQGIDDFFRSIEQGSALSGPGPQTSTEPAQAINRLDTDSGGTAETTAATREQSHALPDRPRVHNGPNWSDADIELSLYWAGVAQELTGKGRRLEAMAAALRGIPQGIREDDLARFTFAHDALYAAVRSNNVSLPLEGRQVDEVAISHDRSRAIISVSHGNGERTWELWDVETETMLTVLRDRGFILNYNAFGFSPNGAYAWSQAGLSSFQLHDARTGEKLGERTVAEPWLNSPSGIIMIGAWFNPSHDLVATVSETESLLRVWSVPELELVMESTLFVVEGADHTRLTAPFVDDETLCVSARHYEMYHFLDPDSHTGLKDLRLGFMVARTGAYEQFYAAEIETSEALITGSLVDCSPDRKWALLRFGDGNWVPTFEAVDVRTGTVKWRFDNFIQHGVAFHPTLPLVALRQYDGLSILDLKTGSLSATLPGVPESYAPGQAVVYDSHGQATTGMDDFNHQSAVFRHIWEQVPTGVQLIAHAQAQLPKELVNASYSAGSHLESEEETFAAKIWAQRSAALLAEGKRLEAIAAALKGIPEGLSDDEIKENYADAYLSLYAAYRSYAVSVPLDAEEEAGSAIVFITPDLSRAVIGRHIHNGTFEYDLWDMTRIPDQPIAKNFGRHTRLVDHAWPTLSEDSRWAAFAGKGGNIHIFDLVDGTFVANLHVAPTFPPASSSHTGEPVFYYTGFSPDGRFFITSAILNAPAQRNPDVTRIWTTPDFREVYSSEVLTNELRPRSVQFIDGDTVCRRDPTDDYLPGQFRVELFDPYGGWGRIDLTGIVEGAMHKEVSCSADGSWLLAMEGYSAEHAFDADFPHHTQLINLRDMQVAHTFDSSMHVKGVFSPDSRELAVFHDDGSIFVRYLDLETLQWRNYPPGAPEDYRSGPAFLHSSRTGQPISQNFDLFHKYGSAMLWMDMPTGAALVEAALEILPPTLVQEALADRL